MTKRRKKSQHVWGTWIGKFRYCISGWCPMGQYRNGRIVVMRPERTLGHLERRGGEHP